MLQLDRYQGKSALEELPIWDLEALLNKLDGDESTARALVEVFLSDYPRQLSALETAASQADPPSLVRAAHALKGAAGALEAPQIYTHCLHLEMMGRQSDLSQMPETMHQLRTDLGLLLKELRDHLSL